MKQIYRHTGHPKFVRQLAKTFVKDVLGTTRGKYSEVLLNVKLLFYIFSRVISFIEACNFFFEPHSTSPSIGDSTKATFCPPISETTTLLF